MKSWMAAALLAPALLAAPAGDPVRFRLEPGTTHQAWESWGCMPNPVGFEEAFVAWLKDPSREAYDRLAMNNRLPSKLISRLHDALVDEIGITRMRLEVGPQVEWINDNDDPFVTDASAYRFAWQDDQVERHILPLKKRIEAAGERLVLYVSYDLRSNRTPAFLLQPEEYAEMAVTFLAHLKERYRIEPDTWSVINEPGNHRPGDPELCAKLTAAVSRRIAKAGFKTRMSGPECVTVAQVARYLEAMERTPGALDRYAQITYHLYHRGAEDAASRRTVRAWAKKLGVTAAQTEWMEGSDLDVARHIHLCLTEADAVSWERFGADGFFELPYDVVISPDSDNREAALNSTAWHIRQYSRHIRPGAVRVGFAGGSDSVKGLAFRPKGRDLPVIVLINTSGEPRRVEIDGLPAGRYARSFTSVPEKAFGRAVPEEVVDAPGRLTIDLPPRSVTTLAGA